MAAKSMCLLVVVVVMSVVWQAQTEDSKEETLKECAGNRHVCTTLMRYPDKYTADEGPYCKCSSGTCGGDWGQENDQRSLTWKHYERVHWSVQYKFCSPILDKDAQVCAGGERAAVVETEVETWSPYLGDLRCRCRDGVLHMTGWKKEGRIWKYFYECNKRECSAGDVCADIYVDTNKKEDIVTEVVFKCACPQGDMCPTKLRDESTVKSNLVSIRCEAIKQSSKEKE